MPLSSMTGFARTSFQVGATKYSWELKSVNGRGLEIRLRLPPGLDHLEPDIRAEARGQLARGNCFFALEKEDGTARGGLSLDEDALALVIAAARRLAAVEGITMPSADGLLAIPGVLRDRGEEIEPAAAEERDHAVLSALGVALRTLAAARQDEGGRLQAVIEEQIARIAHLVEEAAEIAREAPEVLRERVGAQVALLMTEKTNLDPDRLHQEAILAATRADVREELDRLGSHITAARKLIGGGGNVGRRLDFLSQEFNREANTLCSKSFDTRLTAVGVELKAVIDQFREQVQNLE